HTKGLTELMREKKLSYLVVIPKFENGKERPYIAILTNRKDAYEKVLETGEYELAVEAYFQDKDAKLDNVMHAVARAMGEAVAGNRDEAEVKRIWVEAYRACYERNTRERGAQDMKGKVTPDEFGLFLMGDEEKGIKPAVEALKIKKGKAVISYRKKEGVSFITLSDSGNTCELNASSENERKSFLEKKEKGEIFSASLGALKEEAARAGKKEEFERITKGLGSYVAREVRDEAILKKLGKINAEALSAVLMKETGVSERTDLSEKEITRRLKAEGVNLPKKWKSDEKLSAPVNRVISAVWGIPFVNMDIAGLPGAIAGSELVKNTTLYGKWKEVLFKKGKEKRFLEEHQKVILEAIGKFRNWCDTDKKTQIEDMLEAMSVSKEDIRNVSESISRLTSVRDIDSLENCEVFNWFESRVEGKEKYLLGDKEALAVDVLKYLSETDKNGDEKLVEEYILHEILEKAGFNQYAMSMNISQHKAIISVTSEIFKRDTEKYRDTEGNIIPGKTPLGIAFGKFLIKKLKHRADMNIKLTSDEVLKGALCAREELKWTYKYDTPSFEKWVARILTEEKLIGGKSLPEYWQEDNTIQRAVSSLASSLLSRFRGMEIQGLDMARMVKFEGFISKVESCMEPYYKKGKKEFNQFFPLVLENLGFPKDWKKEKNGLSKAVKSSLLEQKILRSLNMKEKERKEAEEKQPKKQKTETAPETLEKKQREEQPAQQPERLTPEELGRKARGILDPRFERFPAPGIEFDTQDQGVKCYLKGQTIHIAPLSYERHDEETAGRFDIFDFPYQCFRHNFLCGGENKKAEEIAALFMTFLYIAEDAGRLKSARGNTYVKRILDVCFGEELKAVTGADSLMNLFSDDLLNDLAEKYLVLVDPAFRSVKDSEIAAAQQIILRQLDIRNKKDQLVQLRAESESNRILRKIIPPLSSTMKIAIEIESFKPVVVFEKEEDIFTLRVSRSAFDPQTADIDISVKMVEFPRAVYEYVLAQTDPREEETARKVAACYLALLNRRADKTLHEEIDAVEKKRGWADGAVMSTDNRINNCLYNDRKEQYEIADRPEEIINRLTALRLSKIAVFFPEDMTLNDEIYSSAIDIIRARKDAILSLAGYPLDMERLNETQQYMRDQVERTAREIMKCYQEDFLRGLKMVLYEGKRDYLCEWDGADQIKISREAFDLMGRWKEEAELYSLRLELFKYILSKDEDLKTEDPEIYKYALESAAKYLALLSLTVDEDALNEALKTESVAKILKDAHFMHAIQRQDAGLSLLQRSLFYDNVVSLYDRISVILRQVHIPEDTLKDMLKKTHCRIMGAGYKGSDLPAELKKLVEKMALKNIEAVTATMKGRVPSEGEETGQEKAMNEKALAEVKKIREAYYTEDAKKTIPEIAVKISRGKKDNYCDLMPEGRIEISPLAYYAEGKIKEEVRLFYLRQEVFQYMLAKDEAARAEGALKMEVLEPAAIYLTVLSLC
ncbi:MAG: hypothetical protein ABH883_09795, partial [Candidatus Omnitrophota bacterium]